MADKDEDDGKSKAGGLSKSFDQYEYVAVITPGAALLLTAALLWHEKIPLDKDTEVTLGAFGIVLVVAYVAGQVLQAVVERPARFVWRVFRGMPSEWILNRSTSLLDDCQIADIFRRTNVDRKDYKIKFWDRLWFRRHGKFEKWQAITRQIYIKVAAANKAGRVDAFNRTYGMMLGLTVVFVFGAGVLGYRYNSTPESVTLYEAIAMLVLALLTLSRAYAFGKLYARELYVSYLEVMEPKADASPAAPPRLLVQIQHNVRWDRAWGALRPSRRRLRPFP